MAWDKRRTVKLDRSSLGSIAGAVGATAVYPIDLGTND
jgi:hypothetical protein